MPVHLKASPLIDQFNEAKSHGDRADILLRAPVRLLCQYRDLFIAGCERTGFRVGADYVATLHVSLDVVRGRDGEIPEHLRMMIEASASALRAMAKSARRRQQPEGDKRDGGGR